MKLENLLNFDAIFVCIEYFFVNPMRIFYSENYIFGKFDAFCKRLEKLDDMLIAMEDLSGLQKIKIEVCMRCLYMSIVFRFAP